MREFREDAPYHSQASGKWIAPIFDIEIKPLRKKNRGAPHGPSAVLGKSESRDFAPEETADAPVGLASNPKPITIATDKEKRNGLAQDSGVGALPSQRRMRFGRVRHRGVWWPTVTVP